MVSPLVCDIISVRKYTATIMDVQTLDLDRRVHYPMPFWPSCILSPLLAFGPSLDLRVAFLGEEIRIMAFNLIICKDLYKLGL
jgi:hypothetical protein